MFASLNTIRGGSKSRRDDIESAFYVLIYLMNGQRLWTDMVEKIRKKQVDFHDLLKLRQRKTYYSQLFKEVP